jgi:alpha-1,3-rhamnosyltransferase
MSSEKMKQIALVEGGGLSLTSFPLVSVIIPAYNHEKYITKALESVFKQNYPQIEVIVIDDKSKDDTKLVLRDLLKKYNFKFIRNEKNMGLTKSLNIALVHTKGKYIAILAGDDYWMPDKTKIQVEFMEQNLNVAACSGNVTKVDGDGNPYKVHLDRKVDKISYRSFEDCIQLKARFPAIVVMIRRDTLMQVGGYDERFVMEDLPLWLKLTSRGYKLAVLPELFGAYRIHGSGLHNDHGKMYESYLRVFEVFKDHPSYDKGMRALYRRQVKFGPYQGWSFLFSSLVRGASFDKEYARNLLICVRSCFYFLKK